MVYKTIALATSMLILSTGISHAQIENVALGKTATASSSWTVNHLPSNAFDGNPATIWNAGAHPIHSIKVDLGASFDVGEIKLTVVQLPDGVTGHDVYVSYDGVNETLAHTFSGYTANGDVLSQVFVPPLVGVQSVKVKTTSSPSWVAWSEIEVLEADVDGDGFSIANDCKDNDAAINPGAIEITGNYVDENCDGDLGACSPCQDWKNHGQFVRCVAYEVQFLPEDDANGLVSSAAQTDIGKKDFVPAECQ